MLRLTDRQAKGLLGALILQRFGVLEGGNTRGALYKLLAQGEIPRDVYDLCIDQDGEFHHFGLRQLESVVNDKLSSQIDGQKELFDSLLETLQRYGGSNSLGGEILKKLRKLFMPQEEYRKLANRLRSEIKCMDCGTEINTGGGELATIIIADGEPRVFCARCFKPHSMACSNHGCDGKAEVPQKIVAFMRAGTQCEACKTGKKVVKQKEIGPDDEPERRPEEDNPFVAAVRRPRVRPAPRAIPLNEQERQRALDELRGRIMGLGEEGRVILGGAWGGGAVGNGPLNQAAEPVNWQMQMPEPPNEEPL
jgi:hypothetical protein